MSLENKNELRLLDKVQRVKKITPQELRVYKGFNSLSEEDAEQLISNMEQYCEVLLDNLERNSFQINT